MGIGSIGGTYLNFILGTGSEEVGRVIKSTVQNRHATGQNYIKSVWSGTRQGVKDSYQSTKANGGFWKNIKAGFSEIPSGWKNAAVAGEKWYKNAPKQLVGAFKGCGKAMPALMAFMMVAGELPNIFKATKDKGVGQGAIETGKAAAKLTGGAIGAAIGTALIPIPFLNSMIGWTVGSMVAGALVGKSYSEKVAANPELANAKENKETKKDNKTVQEAGVPGNATGTTPIAGDPAIAFKGSSVPLPSIDDEDFGPNKPYANVFYPGGGLGGSYMGMGSGLGMGMGMGMNVQPQSSNLLTPYAGNGNQSSNLLTGSGNGYQSFAPNKSQTGNLLNANI